MSVHSILTLLSETISKHSSGMQVIVFVPGSEFPPHCTKACRASPCPLLLGSLSEAYHCLVAASIHTAEEASFLLELSVFKRAWFPKDL